MHQAIHTFWIVNLNHILIYPLRAQRLKQKRIKKKVCAQNIWIYILHLYSTFLMSLTTKCFTANARLCYMQWWPCGVPPTLQHAYWGANHPCGCMYICYDLALSPGIVWLPPILKPWRDWPLLWACHLLLKHILSSSGLLVISEVLKDVHVYY